MNLEQLKSLGLTEEQANSVMKLHKDAINGNYIPKGTFDAERDKSKALQEALDNKDGEIRDLLKYKGDSEKLEARISNLTDSLDKTKQEYENRIAQIEQDAAISVEISDMVHDTKDILGKLDKGKIVFKDGKIVAGLKEQLTELKKVSPHYFKTENSNIPNGWNVGGNKPKEGQDQNRNNGNDNDIGKSLAQAFRDSLNVSKTAEDMYFN